MGSKLSIKLKGQSIDALSDIVGRVCPESTGKSIAWHLRGRAEK